MVLFKKKTKYKAGTYKSQETVLLPPIKNKKKLGEYS